ncbi:MAG: hypothetical protein IPI01_15600 [Ignavibacteriae bacterium]|nr:hypothetical protein [Ignavibacteriota bacterium]
MQVMITPKQAKVYRNHDLIKITALIAGQTTYTDREDFSGDRAVRSSRRRRGG